MTSFPENWFVISSALGGLVTGAFGCCGGVEFPLAFGSLVMNHHSSNSKLVIDTLRDNFREVTEIGKRFGDRMTILMGITATGFGLLVKLSDKQVNGVSVLLLIAAVVGLLCCFGIAALAMFPKKSLQPGSTDVDFLWAEYVARDPEQAEANVIADICHALRHRRNDCDRLSYWFRIQIIVAGFTLLCVVISELISAN